MRLREQVEDSAVSVIGAERVPLGGLVLDFLHEYEIVRF